MFWQHIRATWWGEESSLLWRSRLQDNGKEEIEPRLLSSPKDAEYNLESAPLLSGYGNCMKNGEYTVEEPPFIKEEPSSFYWKSKLSADVIWAPIVGEKNSDVEASISFEFGSGGCEIGSFFGSTGFGSDDIPTRR